MSETKYGNMRTFRFIILVFMIFMVGMVTATVQTHAGSWHKVYLKPGQTYDVSDAGWNTTVYIDKAGTYILKGQSEKCKVVVQSGGVNIYLEDGLKIDPDIKANIGVETAGMIIEDMDGTVKLISKKDASAYFGGYLTAPAIEKVGYKSKLVLETEDPSNPGTITAYRSHSSSSAGIGSAYRFSIPVTTGNIEINSGNVIATGGYMSAGIGGGGTGSAHKIVINGGNVKASGGSHGTGIGGGYHGNASNITINGGTVKAESIGEGAGIGSGEQSKYAKNIIINGGNVRAVSDIGAGIGGGQRSEVENLRINGGTVYAYSRKTGIGSSCDQHLGILKSLYITGGNIVAESKGVAIGAAEQSPGPNNIYISGGNIQAKSDWIAIGGGGFSSVTDDTRITNVTISGGTIQADGGDVHFGTGAWMDQFNIIITGGSILAERDKMDSAPKDQFGNEVERTDVELEGLDSSHHYLVLDTGVSDLPAGYGSKDIYTLNGKLYFWIPAEAKVSSASIAEGKYEGSVESGNNGVLKKVSSEYKVYFLEEEKANNGPITDADIAYTQDFDIDVPSSLKSVDSMSGITQKEDKTFIGWRRVGALGASLYADQALVCNLYSYDAQNNRIVEYYMAPQWIDAGDAMISVSMDNEPYDIRGIKLKKADATFENAFVKDNTKTGIYTYSAQFAASENRALSTGEYDVWIKLSDESKYISTGKTVTIGGSDSLTEIDLYTVKLNDNGSDNGTIEEIKCLYGKAQTLPDCSFEKKGYHFIGWNTGIDGTGKWFEPGDVINETILESKGSVILYAIWEHDFYTVKFDGGDSIGQVPDMQVWTGEELTLSNPGFRKDGYRLAGWNAAADGTGKVYAADEKVSDIAEKNETITLYAQWEYDPEASGDESGNDEKGAPGVADNDRDEEAGTGDRMPIGLIAGIMLAALGVIAAVLFGRKRRTE